MNEKMSTNEPHRAASVVHILNILNDLDAVMTST